MDYKKAFEVLAAVAVNPYYKGESLIQESSEGDDYEETTIDTKIYDIGSEDQFLKVDCSSDSYGENYSIRSVGIVKMKKVTTLTYV